MKINYGFHFFPRYVSIINRRTDENSFKERQRRLIWRHIVKRRRNYFKKRKKEKMLSFHEIKKIIKLCRIIINQRDIIKRILRRIKFSLFSRNNREFKRLRAIGRSNRKKICCVFREREPCSPTLNMHAPTSLTRPWWKLWYFRFEIFINPRSSRDQQVQFKWRCLPFPPPPRIIGENPPNSDFSSHPPSILWKGFSL